MGRKKAIEAAIKRLADCPDEGRSAYIHDELEAMHLEGRIAGLREAARIVASGNAPCSVTMRPDTYAWQKSRDVSKRARQLAKKARGK